jgi:hypothetical protein
LDSDSEFCPVCALNSALQPDNHATATELRFEHYQILKNEDQSLMELGHGAMGVGGAIKSCTPRGQYRTGAV